MFILGASIWLRVSTHSCILTFRIWEQFPESGGAGTKLGDLRSPPCPQPNAASGVHPAPQSTVLAFGSALNRTAIGLLVGRTP